MNCKKEILKVLEQNRNQFISGEALGNSLNVSRQTVSKTIRALCAEGYEIDSRTRLGYKLKDGCDIISAAVICEKTGANVYVYDSVPSTNAVAAAKYQIAGDCMVIGREQTKGRKKNGENFYSPKDKGIYLSVALTVDFPVSELCTLRTKSAQAVKEVVESSCKKSADIRDVDEIYIGGKKVCGILVECGVNASSLRTTHAVIGIGIYTFETCFEDTCLSSVFPNETRNEMVAEIYNRLKERIKNPHA